MDGWHKQELRGYLSLISCADKVLVFMRVCVCVLVILSINFSYHYIHFWFEHI